MNDDEDDEMNEEVDLEPCDQWKERVFQRIQTM